MDPMRTANGQGHVHPAPAEGGQKTVDMLRESCANGIPLPIGWRKQQLQRMAHMLTVHRSDIERAVQLDLGKPAAETSLMETKLVLDEIRFVLPRMARWSQPRPQTMPLLMQPAMSWTVPQPKGVVLIISPWNYPVLLGLEPMVDAIAAGNCVCLKPSEIAPHTSHLLASLIPRYLDRSAIRVVKGGVPETTALLKRHFDHIFYTGGAAVGRIVMRAAAEHLTPVTLELGGKSPVFVDSSADLHVAAGRIAWGKFTNAGQTCVAPDYVLATPDVAPRLGKLIAAATEHFFGSDPQRSASYGRIVSAKHFDRVSRLLPDRHDPATGRLIHGGVCDREHLYMAPTIVMDPALNAPVMNEEIFGPILPIITIEDANAAIEFINDKPRPLALYVFSRDRHIRRTFARRTESGALGFNLPLGHLLSSRLPFGGIGASGMGSYHGKAGFLEFSHAKSVTWKPEHPDTLRLAYPPYGRTARLLGGRP